MELDLVVLVVPVVFLFLVESSCSEMVLTLDLMVVVLLALGKAAFTGEFLVETPEIESLLDDS